jgi:predicted nucleotidyltransferase
MPMSTPQIDPPLHAFVQSAQTAFGRELVAIYLFGSAATGQMRASSDVNLLCVLERFRASEDPAITEALRLARAVIQLHVMFIEEAELPRAAHCFAQKFADIQRRNRLLWGRDCLANLAIAPAELAQSAQQTLCNFVLRSREQFLLHQQRPEQLQHLLAQAAAPLRTSAATLHYLAKGHWCEGKEALAAFAAGQPQWQSAVAHLSEAREDPFAPSQKAAEDLNNLLALASALSSALEAHGGHP